MFPDLGGIVVRETTQFLFYKVSVNSLDPEYMFGIPLEQPVTNPLLFLLLTACYLPIFPVKQMG